MDWEATWTVGHVTITYQMSANMPFHKNTLACFTLFSTKQTKYAFAKNNCFTRCTEINCSHHDWCTCNGNVKSTCMDFAAVNKCGAISRRKCIAPIQRHITTNSAKCPWYRYCFNRRLPQGTVVAVNNETNESAVWEPSRVLFSVEGQLICTRAANKLQAAAGNNNNGYWAAPLA